MIEKNIPRRLFVLGGLSTFALGLTGLRELAQNIELEFGRYAIQTVSHNASDTPRKFERALLSGSDFVEIDISIIDGKIVAAHDIDSYLQRTDEEKVLLSPNVLIEKTREAKKGVMIDLKPDVIDMSQLQELGLTEEDMVSSKNHALLLNLRKKGFDGALLFSIDSNSSLRNFLTTYGNEDYSNAESPYGVSIRHSLLWGVEGKRVANRLRSMGLSIATWTPNTDAEIHAASKRANIIISDNYGALKA